MSNLYDLGRLVDRRVYDDAPKIPPGVALSEGFLPVDEYAGFKYAHVDRIEEDGSIVPSPETAIDSRDARMLLPGEVVTVEVTNPTEMVKHIGSAILGDAGICFDQKPTL